MYKPIQHVSVRTWSRGTLVLICCFALKSSAGLTLLTVSWPKRGCLSDCAAAVRALWRGKVANAKDLPRALQLCAIMKRAFVSPPMGLAKD